MATTARKRIISVNGFSFQKSRIEAILEGGAAGLCPVSKCSNEREEGRLVCQYHYREYGNGILDALREAAARNGTPFPERKVRHLEPDEWRKLVGELSEVVSSNGDKPDKEMAEELGEEYPSYSFFLIRAALKVARQKRESAELIHFAELVLREEPSADGRTAAVAVKKLSQSRAPFSVILAAVERARGKTKKFQELLGLARKHAPSAVREMKRDGLSTKPSEVANHIFAAQKLTVPRKMFTAAVAQVMRDLRDEDASRLAAKVMAMGRPNKLRRKDKRRGRR